MAAVSALADAESVNGPAALIEAAWPGLNVEDSNLTVQVAALRRALEVLAAEAKAVVPLLSGSTFAKHQIIDAEDAVPFVTFDYAGGRSLRHIIERARGGTGAAPNPVPSQCSRYACLCPR